jgi:hypothetical protein
MSKRDKTERRSAPSWHVPALLNLPEKATSLQGAPFDDKEARAALTGIAFGSLPFLVGAAHTIDSKREFKMFDMENLMALGVFNQLIPVWHVFFFIAGMLPFMLLNRVKICLLITYLFTFYLGFMVQWGDYIASTGSMQPFVLYSFSGLAIAVFFVATIFNETPQKTKVRWVRYNQGEDENVPSMDPRRDPLEHAVNVTQSSENDGFTTRLR